MFDIGISDIVDQLPLVVMVGLYSVAVLLCAGGALAGVNYPVIPKDLTTPFQQRLAVHGSNGE